MISNSSLLQIICLVLCLDNMYFCQNIKKKNYVFLCQQEYNSPSPSQEMVFQYQMCYSEQGCPEDLIVLGRDEAEVLVLFQTLRQPEVQSSAEVKKISFK